MKIFVTDKYRIITFLLICTTIIISAHFAGNSDAMQTVSQTRKLPIYSVERSDNTISVTFDCAWGADDIDKIIDVLKDNNCPATFFVLGTWAEKYPEAVSKLVEAGHEIGNHSYNHTYYTHLSESEIKDDIKKCNEAIKDACGTQPVLFRAPAGDYNDSVVSVCEEINMPYLQWDVDSLDWKSLSYEKMNKRIMDKVRSGSIILFHNDTAHTAESLDAILKNLSNAGYKFVKGSELIYKDNFIIDNTGRQFKNK